jgi:GNAT superfamily N-acetyltransferase
VRQPRESRATPGEAEGALSRDVEVARTYLELRSLAQLRPSTIDDPAIQYIRCDNIVADHYRLLYRAVGDEWYWHDRNAWSDEQLAAYVASPDIAVWECLVENESAGYFELARRDDGSVEIAYFGLSSPFIGRGIGKAMLTRAAQEAWALGPTRVWLHTCTLDSPYALPNYLARGFEETRKETYVATQRDRRVILNERRRRRSC